MTLTSEQKRALAIIEGNVVWLVRGYHKIRGIFQNPVPKNEFVTFEKEDKFIVIRGPLIGEDTEIEIDSIRYYKRSAPQTVSRRIIGELVNKGLVELKITTTRYQTIFPVITSYGRKILAESS